MINVYFSSFPQPQRTGEGLHGKEGRIALMNKVWSLSPLSTDL